MVSPGFEDSKVIRVKPLNGSMMLPHMQKEGGTCIAILGAFCTGAGDEGFHAVDALSIGEDRRAIRLLSRNRPEGRADDFALASLRANLLSLAATRTRHVGSDPNLERYDPDLWTDEFAFLSQAAQADIQSDLFYDYRKNVDAYPEWQAWMGPSCPLRRSRLLGACGDGGAARWPAHQPA
jgi:hypothetical protein